MTAPPAATPGALSPPLALRRSIDVLLWLMVGANVLFFIGLVLTDAGNDVVNVVIALACQWIPVTIFWLAVARTKVMRTPVVLAAAGVTFSAMGEIYYSFAVDSDGFLAFPSPADVGYLLFYPFMIAALAALIHSRLRGVGGLVLLETIVATVGASAVIAVLLGPVIDDALANRTFIESAISIGYPLFDLILIAMIVGIATVPSVRIGRRWWALTVGLGIFLAGDVAYAVLESHDEYIIGTPLDAIWTVGLAFITWWVAGVAHHSAEPVKTSREGLAVVLPAAAVFAGLAVLVIGTTTRLSVLAVVLAALTVALGAAPFIFRQAMLGRMLAAQDEAVRRLTELDRAKTDMLVTVNHEFRTPLTSINGHVELLLDGIADEMSPAATDMLRTIERNGAKLQRLVDETFTASRLDELDADLVRTPLDVAEIVTRAVEDVEPAARSRGVALSLLGGDVDLTVRADGARLERALASLVDNAIKFTDPGGHATVTVEPSAAGGEVVIRVSDSGIGIPVDEIPHLFTRFFRASNVRTAAIPGVGLGLSISRQVVHAHGGTIEVDSAAGSGTTMTVRIPVADGVS